MNSQRFTNLTNEELDRNLRALQEKTDHCPELDRLQEALQELQVHQIELEMHNRALRDTQVELEHSIQRYADLYDNLPIAYLTMDASGVIAAANRAAHEWLRPDARGLTGQYFGKYLDAYDAGRVSAHLEYCVKSGAPSTMELTLRPPGSEPLLVQLASRPAPVAPGTSRLIHVAISDISKLKQAQKILMEINREQEAFNYSISHDLRAPLITINNYAGIVLNDFATGLGEEGRAMVERIRSAATRMENTLKHLLEYSTLAREDIVLTSVNADEVVRDLLVEHRGVLQEKGAEVTVDRPLPNVYACAPILNQVLANLLTNAVKYCRQGEAPDIRFTADVRPTTVVLKVIDRGIGIDPKYHEKIFRLFERLHGYSKYPGSGVGLAIARRAIERMNGRIWVESEPGKGSCFCLELAKV
jgi:PAS domain S-box-containing protein